MTPTHLAELQAAWPGAWVPSTVQDDDDNAVQMLIHPPYTYGAAFVDEDGLRWACIDYRTTQAYLYCNAADFKSAVAKLKKSIEEHIAPFNAVLETMS